MIAASAELAAALRAQSVTIRPRITWEHGGLSGTPENSLDLSDRLISFPSCSISVGAYLDGARESRSVLTLDNSDRMLSPGSGLFSNRVAAERQMARVTVELGAQLPGGSFGYSPIFVGYVLAMVYRPGQVDLDLVSPFQLLMQATIPEDIVIEPWPDSTSGNTVSSLIQSIITDNTVMSAGDFDFTWATMDAAYTDLDWVIGGRIHAGTTLASACESLARSGCATIVPREDGTLSLVSELPEQATYRHDHYGDLIDEPNANDWSAVEAVDIACTSVAVAFNSVSVRYPTTPMDEEDDVGTLSRLVACPYIYLGRTAELVAYILHTQYSIASAPLAVSWSMDLRGSLIQVMDRARVLDPVTGVERTVRIVSKAYGNGRVFLGGVADGHESSIVQGSFAEWGVTTWGSGAVL